MHLKGIVPFSMIGAYCEDLINELTENGTELSEIRNKENIIYADTAAVNYPAVAKLSRKYGVRVRVKNRAGAYFRLAAFRQRPGLIAGVFVSAAMVLTMRLFVWHIEIHGNNVLSKDHILGLLEQNGFTAGVLANNTDALSAERNIMLASDKIRWINIEVNGSRADVYINENDDPERPEVDMKTPCNIVASRAGVIAETNVTSGKLMCEPGSGVAEGSVLVSGAVSSGTSLILVHSDAEIIAEFNEEKRFAADYTTTEKVPADEMFTHRQMMIFGIVIPLDGNAADTANTFCTESTEQCRIAGFDIPVRIKTETYRKYKEITVTRTSHDVRKQLEQRLELYINNFLREYELIDIAKTYEETETGLALNAVIKLRGNIGVKKPIYEH